MIKRFQGPDGKVHRLEVPDNASQEDIVDAINTAIETLESQPEKEPGVAESVLLGGLKGVSLGGSTLPPSREPGEFYTEEQRQDREQLKKAMPEAIEKAREAHPVAYEVSKFAGGIAPGLLTSMTGFPIATAGALGGLAGIGSATERPEATPAEVATSGALGGLLGLGLGIAPKTASSVLSKLSKWTSELPEYLSKDIFEAASKAKIHESFDDQLEAVLFDAERKIKATAPKELQKKALEELGEQGKSLKKMLGGLSNPLSGKDLNSLLIYSLKAAIGAGLGLPVGHPILGSVLAGATSNPALAGLGQQLLGTASQLAPKLAPAAAALTTGILGK